MGRVARRRSVVAAATGAGLLTMMIAATAWAGGGVVGAVDGSCNGPTDANEVALAELGEVVASAGQVAKDCIPEGDARRASAEQNERRALESSFGKFVKSICADRICVNNGWGFVLDAYDDQRYDWNTLMAGCGRWADEVSNSMTAERPKYWEIREAQYGKGSGRPGYHWVVEMRNTRTGEVFLLDGYEASKSGRNWLGSNMSDPARIRASTGVRTRRAVERQWGKRNDAGYSCRNRPGTLCDGSGCGGKQP